MKSVNCLLLASLSGCFLLLGCNSESNTPNESEQEKKVVVGKMSLENGWARPGSQQGKSAAYLCITNSTSSTDTLLLSFSSDAAQRVELHKSIENKDGTTSMHPAEQQILEPTKKLNIQPGGLHLMLINLNRDLAVGDSLNITFEFARLGKKTIKVPVQIQN